MATEAQRKHAVSVMDFMHKHAAHLAYPLHDQRGPLDSKSWRLTESEMERLLDHGGTWDGDCSEFGSYVLKCAGLWRFGSPGWTGSHLDLLGAHRYTDGKNARSGALVICGMDTDPNGKHEMIVHTADPKDGDPIVASHGRPGFDLLRVSQIAVGELAGHVYLPITHL
jgi:hypothetical protein